LEELLPDQNTQWIWETLANEDWHLAWQDHFKPIVINNKLAVIPYWDDNIHAEFTIKIKPGMAFGTGHHETTWLVLRHMLKYVTSGSSVLDLGTGSGILSIAAMQLGAEIVDAVEQDSACESNFYENLKLNEITEGIQYHNGDVLTWNQLDYNLILANINRSVIEQLIPRLKSFKGKILLSGILESEYQNIEKLCYYNSFQVKERMIKGEWVCLVIE
jgi:ribosomal protein L11 methyltransferase